MTRKFTLQIAAISGALSVIVGAFGAHGLHELLVESDKLNVFETAVNYQFYHSLALLLVGLLLGSNNNRYLSRSALFFGLGILVFSGSLYVLSVTNYTVLGAITPVGGVLFILGWLALFRFANSTQQDVNSK